MSSIASNTSLKTAITTGKLIPLVGAGVSMSIKDNNGNSVFPSWVKLLQNAAMQLNTEDAELVNQAIDAGMLLEAAQEAKKHLIGNRWYLFLESQFNPDLIKCDSSSFELPKALWQLSNRFITLNYDNLLKHTSGASNTKIITNSSDATLNTFRSTTESKMIWHLHGHIDTPEELILTFDSYKHFYVEEKYKAAMDVLKSVLATQSLLFIGCSLKDAELLAELSKQFELFAGNTPAHFALVHQKEEPLIKLKLKDIPNIKILTFSDFGQPLVDTINEIAALKADAPQLEHPLTSKPPAQIATQPNQPQIAYLNAKPFGETLGDFTAVEKALKNKPPYNISSFALSLANLQSLSEVNYLVLACQLKSDKLIIENDHCGSERITLNELENNLALDALHGMIVICDQLPSRVALSDITLPIIFIPELLAIKNLNNLWFQLFKKQSLSLFEQHGLLWNTSQFILGDTLKSLNGQWLSATNKLPTELSKYEIAKFIGRTQDLEEVSRRLFQAQLHHEFLTILGTGGLGKTSLVKKLAYEYNERKLFDDGIFFIDCEHATSYQQFHRHIAEAFDLADAVDVIGHLTQNPELGQGQRLIIIDNAESLLVLAEKNKILALIGKTNQLATLLITSRENLNIASETTYQLRDFVADEALQLFASKAKRQFSAEENVFLKEHILKEYLDHNPLAIALVASTLVQGKKLESLRDELKTHFFELTQQNPNQEIDATERNIDRRDSIYNSIDYSYRQLTDSAKEALIKLSYFPDGINLEAFKKLTAQYAKARGKNPIKDFTIKALQDKSLLQTNQQHLRLHPLVARFAKQKVNPTEEASYLQAIFHFQLSFISALRKLNRDYDLTKQVLAKKLCQTQINNFCFMLEKLNPAFNHQDIVSFVNSVDKLLSELEIYQIPYDALKCSIDLFANHAELSRYLTVVLLSWQYCLGDFSAAYSELQAVLPVEQWLTLGSNKPIERVTFRSAALIYSNEGMHYEETVYNKKQSLLSLNYNDALANMGIFNLTLAEVCLQNRGSLYVKWASNTLELPELNRYLASLPAKAHIEGASILCLKAKLIRLEADEINKLVVVNPYTQGVKQLLQALHNENNTDAKSLFQQALSQLKHIKFAYTEALLDYATWLNAQGDADFAVIYQKGINLAKQYHYRFLQHGFLQLTAAIKTPYNETDYPLPNGEDFSAYIELSIK
ncbi:SIR2 family protein [Pseudoalteromonas tunicata]|uniref:SIR2 family protein n=1 Tax=Pseudoalteromonas tunicata TaxID=314281 RepID=UPI00273DA2B8|nr:SIR2 family protein [Pseudoalteromonas tunicata]MDP5212298.1 SIR2 family protein [Pseudoalteromonas tunicata]